MCLIYKIHFLKTTMNSGPRCQLWTIIDIEFGDVMFAVDNNDWKEFFSVLYWKTAPFLKRWIVKKVFYFSGAENDFVWKNRRNDRFRASNYVRSSKDRLKRRGPLSIWVVPVFRQGRPDVLGYRQNGFAMLSVHYRIDFLGMRQRWQYRTFADQCVGQLKQK